jgi:hypothetical protein
MIQEQLKKFISENEIFWSQFPSEMYDYEVLMNIPFDKVDDFIKIILGSAELRDIFRFADAVIRVRSLAVFMRRICDDYGINMLDVFPKSEES